MTVNEIAAMVAVGVVIALWVWLRFAFREPKPWRFDRWDALGDIEPWSDAVGSTKLDHDCASLSKRGKP